MTIGPYRKSSEISSGRVRETQAATVERTVSPSIPVPPAPQAARVST